MDTSTKWLEVFKERNALWQMEPGAKYHVKTSLSGKHVNTYFNSDLIVSEPVLIEEIIQAVLLPRLNKPGFQPDWVVGYAPYGLFLAYECARLLNAKCGYTQSDMGYKTSFQIPKNSKVLVVADDIYSGGSTLSTIKALEAMGTEVLPYVFCLTNLSSDIELANRDIIAAAEFQAIKYDPTNCSLCKNGSEALLPRDNWTKLLAA